MKFNLYEKDYESKKVRQEIDNMQEKLNTIKEMPKVLMVYNYLVEHCIGYESRENSYKIMKELGINNNEMFREYIQRIRNSDEYDLVICSQAGKKGGYWVATNEKEVEETLEHLYKRALEMLVTYRNIKKRTMLNNQFKIKFFKTDNEIVESIRGEE